MIMKISSYTIEVKTVDLLIGFLHGDGEAFYLPKYFLVTSKS